LKRADPTTGNRLSRQFFVSLISDASLVLAVVMLFIEDGKRYSAGATTIWLAIETLRLTSALPWSWGALAILALNVRGIVLEDGPTPVSHMDYVLIIIAFLVGFGRSAQRWRRTAALVSGACLLGVLLNAEVIIDFAWWAIEYQAHSLTKNQTALLAGVGALCGVMAALLGRRQVRWWLPMLPCIAASMILARATTSRAALGLVPLALLLAALLINRHRLSPAARRGLGLAAVLVPLSLLAIVLVVEISAPGSLLGWFNNLYGAENIANDIGRFRVWGCYLGLPFMGENRFIYGVGFQNSWQLFCTPEVTGRFLTHSHNLLLQIWAENGVVPLALVVFFLVLMIRRVLRNTAHSPQPGRGQEMGRALAFSSTALFLYLLGFHMVELGMMKVPILTALFGYFLAAIYPPSSLQKRSLQVDHHHAG